MKTIILLGGFGSRMRPHTWSRPKALMRVAGNTVLGHLLDEMADITDGDMIFVIGYKGDQIKAWIEANYGHLKTHFVVQEQALGQAHAVWLCRDHLDDEDVVVGFGDGVITADYTKLPQRGSDLDSNFLVKHVEDPRSFGIVKTNDDGYVTAFVEKPPTTEFKKAVAGINWFKSGTFLKHYLDRVMDEDLQTLGEYYMADAYQLMIKDNAKISTASCDDWLDGGKPDNILQTNARLLGMGHGTDDAIERSYNEEFTVLPPVYIHPDAVIENSVIGPYVSIDAGVTVKNSVLRDCIIDENAHVENVVLSDSLVGEKAKVNGSPKKLFVGDNSIVDLG